MIGHAPYHDLAQNFIVTLPRILSFLRKHDPPFIARVYRPTPGELKKLRPVGRVELWLG